MNIIITAKHLSQPNSLASLKNKRKLTFLLNMAQTVLRISDTKVLEKVFPLGGKFREEDYIFNYVKIGGRYLHGAVPVKVSQAVIELAQQTGAKLSNIAALELLEHRLIEKLHGSFPGLLLFIAQTPGIRLLVFENGLPAGCYFFSGNPKYRTQELSRIINYIGVSDFEWTVFDAIRKYCETHNEEIAWLTDFFADKKAIELDYSFSTP